MQITAICPAQLHDRWLSNGRVRVEEELLGRGELDLVWSRPGIVLGGRIGQLFRLAAIERDPIEVGVVRARLTATGRIVDPPLLLVHRHDSIDLKLTVRELTNQSPIDVIEVHVAPTISLRKPEDTLPVVAEVPAGDPHENWTRLDIGQYDPRRAGCRIGGHQIDPLRCPVPANEQQF